MSDAEPDLIAPVEELDPVELVEVDEDGPEPPEEWGADGAGEEDPAAVEGEA